MNNPSLPSIEQMLQDNFATSLRTCRTWGKEDCCSAKAEPTSSSYPYGLVDLLNTDRLQQMIHRQAEWLACSDHMVVGTLFAKRFSVFFMGGAAVASLYDRLLSTDLAHIRFSVNERAIMFYEAQWCEEDKVQLAKGEQRKQQLSAYVHDWLSTLDIVICRVAEYTGIPSKSMWSILSHNLQTMYNELLSDHSYRLSADRQQLLRQDLAVWTSQAKQAANNPLAIRFRSFVHPLLDQAPFLIRKHCCFAYKLEQEDHAYCRTCPKLRPEQRLQLCSSGK